MKAQQTQPVSSYLKIYTRRAHIFFSRNTYLRLMSDNDQITNHFTVVYLKKVNILYISHAWGGERLRCRDQRWRISYFKAETSQNVTD